MPSARVKFLEDASAEVTPYPGADAMLFTDCTWDFSLGRGLRLHGSEHRTKVFEFDDKNLLRMLAPDGSSALFLEEGAASAANEAPGAYLNVREASNFSTLASGGTVHGDTIKTTFSKVRVLLPSLEILCSDWSYATPTGTSYIVGSNGSTRTDYTCSLYGFAQGSCGPDAHACVDLRGTPFAVATTWGPTGCSAQSYHRIAAGGQTVAVAGTGGQGAAAPVHPETGKPQYPCLGDGVAKMLWTQGSEGREFVLKLCFVEDAPAKDTSDGYTYGDVRGVFEPLNIAYNPVRN